MGWLCGKDPAQARQWLWRKEKHMGVSLSFLAIKGAAPAGIHSALGVTDTGIASSEDDYPIPPVRGAALPNGGISSCLTKSLIAS